MDEPGSPPQDYTQGKAAVCKAVTVTGHVYYNDLRRDGRFSERRDALNAPGHAKPWTSARSPIALSAATIPGEKSWDQQHEKDAFVEDREDDRDQREHNREPDENVFRHVAVDSAVLLMDPQPTHFNDPKATIQGLLRECTDQRTHELAEDFGGSLAGKPQDGYPRIAGRLELERVRKVQVQRDECSSLAFAVQDQLVVQRCLEMLSKDGTDVVPTGL